jgi:hypothetical protein
VDRIEQFLMPEGLGKKLHRSRLHGLDRHRNVSVSRKKNDGNADFPSLQLVLQIQAADAGQSHIQNQATRTVPTLQGQKFLRSSKTLRVQPDGLQQFLERLAHVSIIVDDKYRR